jgi:hypothetical protein
VGLAKYRFLVLRMNDDMHTMVASKTNQQYLCDVEVFLGLTCIMPLLEAVHAFIKFAQAQDCFVCDFITFMKMCCAELYNMYFDLEKKYSHEHFKAFLDLHEGTFDQQLIAWWTNLTSNILWFFTLWASNT